MAMIDPPVVRPRSKRFPLMVHSDFHLKMEEIQKYYKDKHHMDLPFNTLTKIIAERIRPEDVDIFDKEDSFRKKLRKVGEVKSGFGYTPIMR